MIRLFEAMVFGSLAVGLHLAALTQVSEIVAGGDAASRGAPAAVAVVAPDAALRAAVAAWDEPPRATVRTPRLEQPERLAVPRLGGDVKVARAAPPAAPLPPAPESPPQASETFRPTRPEPRPEAMEAASAARPSAGAAGSVAQATAPPAAVGAGAAELEAKLAVEVRAALAREKIHPRRAIARGISGTARLQLTLARDGRPLAIRLTGGSGSALLDQATLDAARRVGRYPVAPPELGGAAFTFIVDMVYEIRD